MDTVPLLIKQHYLRHFLEFNTFKSSSIGTPDVEYWGLSKALLSLYLIQVENR